MPAEYSALERLKALLGWAMRVRLEGGLPFLPSTSPQVRDMLTRSLRYVAKVLKLNSTLKDAVKQAKKHGDVRGDLPDDVILFSYYARTCDPAVEYLRLYAKMSDDEIVEQMLSVYFEGVQPRSTVR
jgi:hypothetical protein